MPGKYRDEYFGQLADDLGGGNALVFGLLYERWKFQLGKLKLLDSRVPVVPFEAYVTPLELLACALRALKEYFRPMQPKGNFEIDGEDVSLMRYAKHVLQKEISPLVSEIQEIVRRLVSVD